MNKGRRHELKQLKYKRRLKMIGASSAETLANPKGHKYNYTGYKNSSNPCSCIICSPYKYIRAKAKKSEDINSEIKRQVGAAYLQI